MKDKIIAVVGATGAQGGAVVRTLKERGKFKVRALTRNPQKYQGPADEVVQADINKPETLRKAFEGAYGVFAVTNFWEPGGIDEVQHGKAMVDAAKAAGVQHYVWSSLPDVKAISNDRYHVPHFTDKAAVDRFVRDAKFKYYTFVEAPFYFQNLAGMLSPQLQEDGSKAWTLPIDPSKRVIHMADINDLGKVVAGAFEKPEKAGNGARLSLAAGMFSFNDVLNTLKNQGHNVKFNQVSPDEFAGYFEGAREFSEMLGYFSEYTYMGPDGAKHIAKANEVATGQPVDFATWAKKNMPAEMVSH